MKKAWSIISSVLVALVVLLAIALVGVRLFGLQVYTVLSGSMEPTYHTGSLIYVKRVDPFTITPGQPITFLLDEDTVATHRVTEVVPDAEDSTVIRFRTKGDANEAEDAGLVHYKNVIGVPVFTVPYLGYVADYIAAPAGDVYCPVRRRSSPAAGNPAGSALRRQEGCTEEKEGPLHRAAPRRKRRPGAAPAAGMTGDGGPD